MFFFLSFELCFFQLPRVIGNVVGKFSEDKHFCAKWGWLFVCGMLILLLVLVNGL